jgi:nicotinamidase-related amidase
MAKQSRTSRRTGSALVIIDMINPLDFPGGAQLLRHARPVARKLATLKQRLKAAGVAAIYVNDNFTHWLNDFGELVAICSQPDVLGAPLARLLPPEEDDYTILKPQHSAFYNTPLEVLLRQLQVRRVILTGIAADLCIVASAIDAHMRGFEVVVPRDCVASNTPQRNRNALALMKNMDVTVMRAAEVMAR